MKIADRVERIASAEVAQRNLAGKRNQLKELADVEAVLASIGVSLEPVFDICLTTRIGLSPRRRKP